MMRFPFIHAMFAAAVLSASLLCPSEARAGNSGDMITYQGKLTDVQGAAQTGSFDFEFALYDASTSGTLLWTESHTSVAVDKGFYRVDLGGTTALSSTVFANNAVYLELKVRRAGQTSFDTLSPRVQLGSVAYAFNAKTVEGKSLSYLLDAANLTGTISSARLPAGLNGATDASTLTLGTLPDARLSTNVTLLGNVTNSAGGLVVLDSVGALPALDAGLLYGVTAAGGSGLFTGTFSGFFSGDGSGLTGLPVHPWGSVSTGTISYMGGNVGIGTMAPAEALVIARDVDADLDILTADNSGINGDFSSIHLKYSRGTLASPGLPVSDDKIGKLEGEGFDGSTYLEASSVRFYIDGTPGLGDMPGRIQFKTRAPGDTKSRTRMTIKGSGKVGIGTKLPGAQLTVDTDPGEGNTALEVLQKDTSFNPTALSISNLGTGDSLNINTSALVVKGSGNVGIGTLAPYEALVIARDVDADLDIITADNSGTNNDNSSIHMRYSRGTLASPALPVSGDEVGKLEGEGFDGSTYVGASSVRFYIDGTPGLGDMPGRIQFKTRGSGATYSSTRMTIKSSGKVGIGTKYPGAQLTVDTDPGEGKIALEVLQEDTSSNPTALSISNLGTGDSLNINTSALVVKGSGNVGIGTATPLAMLDINGDAVVRGTFLNFGATSGAAGPGLHVNTAGTIQFKNSGGSWQNLATGGGGSVPTGGIIYSRTDNDTNLINAGYTQITENAGAAWTQATASASFSARSGHTSLVFNSKMWVIGGSTTSGLMNDVWSSTDGVTWTLVTAAAAFPIRQDHASVVFGGKMWVIGGSDGATKYNDVWSSADGVTWTQATAAAAFSGREMHASLVFNSKMWVIGGTNGVNRTNDVWSSSDGITWVQDTAGAFFSARSGHSVAVFDGKMWVIGGSTTNGLVNDVWYSTDGANWVQSVASAAFVARNLHKSVVFNGKLWVIAGTISPQQMNDVWSSGNGANWTQSTASTAFAARISFDSVVFNNKIWVIAGNVSGGGVVNDVWFSDVTPAQNSNGYFAYEKN